jgi:hypothetical protein
MFDNEDISNKDISLDFIESHINENWNFFTLTHNEAITKEFILKHKDKPWDFNYYKFLKTLTMTELLEVQHKIEDFETLSRNHNITLEYIFENEDKKWCWFEISKRPDISQDFVNETKPLNFYLLFINNNKIDYKADFLVEYRNRIIVDFENYSDQLSVYEKVKEQSNFIKILMKV